MHFRCLDDSSYKGLDELDFNCCCPRIGYSVVILFFIGLKLPRFEIARFEIACTCILADVWPIRRKILVCNFTVGQKFALASFLFFSG